MKFIPRNRLNMYNSDVISINCSYTCSTVSRHVLPVFSSGNLQYVTVTTHFDMHHLAFGINLLLHSVNLILIILLPTFLIPII